MAVPEKVDAVQTGQDRLLHQWTDKPVVQGLTKSYLRAVQELEDALEQLLTERGIFVAVGEQLDVLGSIVGEPRQGLSDNRYRQAILSRVSANQGSGTPNQLLNIVRQLSGTDFPAIWEHFENSVHLYGDSSVSHENMLILNDSMPATVSVRYMFDVDRESFIPAELVEVQDVLGVDTGEIVQVVDDVPQEYDLGIQGFGTAFSGRSFLAEIAETTIVNPLCEVLDERQYTITTDNIVNEDGDQLINEDNDTLYAADLIT